jgi:hypothetical protein
LNWLIWIYNFHNMKITYSLYGNRLTLFLVIKILPLVILTNDFLGLLNNWCIWYILYSDNQLFMLKA